MNFFKDIFNKITGSEQAAAVVSEAELDNDFIDNFEEELIRSDLGLDLAIDFTDRLRKKIKSEKLYQSQLEAELKNYLLEAFDKQKNFFSKKENIFDEAVKLKLNEGLTVFLILGVNGVGKTTSIAKLANRYSKQGKKVLVAAGDTFRAAAAEQLEHWASRAGADFVAGDDYVTETSDEDVIAKQSKAKSSAVVYKALEKAKADNYDLLLIDTAGRLQNKSHLMDELAKISQVINKNTDEGTLTETLLVLDASTGQNALSQTEAFDEISNLTGIILTKFDGSSKAGVVFSIARKFNVPVKLLGTGEGLEDLEDFELGTFLSKYS